MLVVDISLNTSVQLAILDFQLHGILLCNWDKGSLFEGPCVHLTLTICNIQVQVRAGLTQAGGGGAGKHVCHVYAELLVYIMAFFPFWKSPLLC